MPAGFRVYRIRKNLASTDIGTKGLPVLREDHVAWSDTVYKSLQGTSFPGKMITDTLSVRNWKPYFYQATAIGVTDPDRGWLPGESSGSSTLQTYFPPTSLPALSITGVFAIPGTPTVQFSTDIPFETVDLGRATIEVFKLITTGGTVKKSLAATFFADSLPSGTAPDPTLSVLIPDSGSGTTTLSLVLPDGFLNGVIRVSDPLRKSSETEFKIV